MSEPKDAAAARQIIERWEHPIRCAPKEYAEHLRNNPGGNARSSYTPALKVISKTPPMPELAPRGKAVAE